MAEFELKTMDLIVIVVVIIIIIILARPKKQKHLYENYKKGEIIAKKDKYGHTKYMQRTDKDGFGAWKFIKEPKQTKRK
jgi:hypothetical protein